MGLKLERKEQGSYVHVQKWANLDNLFLNSPEILLAFTFFLLPTCSSLPCFQICFAEGTKQPLCFTPSFYPHVFGWENCVRVKGTCL